MLDSLRQALGLASSLPRTQRRAHRWMKWGGALLGCAAAWGDLWATPNALGAPPSRPKRASAIAQPADPDLRPRASELHAAATSSSSQLEARRAIDVRRATPAYRQAIERILADPSLFRRLPTSVIDCDPALFSCLVENPEVLVAIWRELGISKVELERVGPAEFRLSDGAGTTGRLVLVDQVYEPAAQNRVTMYAEGSFEGKPFTRPVSARCVLLLRSGSVVETNGRTFVAARLDSFVKFDRPGLELAAKVLHPWVGNTADRNFADTLTFISNLSYTAEHRPDSMEQLAVRLENVDAPRRQAFVQAAFECAERGKQVRETRAQSGREPLPAIVEASASASTRLDGTLKSTPNR